MLEVRDLSVGYGQHVALDSASVRVGKGEIVVILGANGAGKSTLLKAVSGICEGQVRGSVRMEGNEILGLAPNRIVEEGIALVPEGRGIFGDLSVQENLTLGAYSARARDEKAGNLERVYALFPKLRERRRQVARTMSGGEQQMVAIGRAMMSSPAILALDEPSLGLSPLLCKELFQTLERVRAAGIGILLVEQNAKQSLAIADRGYLLETGRIVHEDSAAALAKDPAVQRAYLGGGAAVAPRVAPKAAAPAAQARPAAAPAPAPRAPAVNPSDIAAAAMQKFGQRRAEPTPAPEPSRPAPAPQPAPRPMPAPPPAATPAPRPLNGSGTAAATPAKGIDIGDLVARAARTSRESVSHGAPNVRPPATTPRPASPAPAPFTMPDLSKSSDRLKSALAEIEEAAARARSYRPPRS